MEGWLRRLSLMQFRLTRSLEIVGLYGKRWDVELDLRHLKTQNYFGHGCFAM
ncbi:MULTISPECIES: hypothetical protein [unclassified Calothrix]|uniref:hypothetical protein n=1 Tax=unclassified Calothrix TaxID=2619626 RepID=UPI0018EF72FA|nr:MULTISPECIES: hypothetical protein [unclassified Calothrix]